VETKENIILVVTQYYHGNPFRCHGLLAVKFSLLLWGMAYGEDTADRCAESELLLAHDGARGL
jgi:hypothetical protein